jgi:SAM-dependent methyltransferase
MQTEQFQLHSRMEENHWWFTGRREILRQVIHQALPPAGQTILDIGCGTGGNLAAFASEYRCIGWDPSDEAIGLARRRYPSVRFFSGLLQETLASLPQPPDLILANDVLEHVRADEALLSQLVRAVRPGGWLLITVPAGMELWSPHDVSVGHVRRYERTQLERLWAGQPVSASLVSYYNARLYPVVRCVRFVTRRSGQAHGEARTDFRMPPAPVNRLLHRFFAAEAGVLVDLMRGKRSGGFARGVSLIALLKKKEAPSNGS